MFKNIEKNLKSVAIGTAGVIAGDMLQHKLMHKIPMIGEKPLMRTLAAAALGVIAMDYQFEFGFGMAVSQLANTAYTFEKVAEFTGHGHINGMVLNGNVLSAAASNVIDGINSEVAQAIADYRASGQVLNGISVSIGA